MGWYEKITAAKNQAANNAYWGGVIDRTVTGSVESISNELQTRRKAEANETAISTLNPNLAGKGLGEALARNPSLSDSLLQPYIRNQYDIANDDRTYQRSMDLEKFSNQNILDRERINDERDMQNARTLRGEELDFAPRRIEAEERARRQARIAESGLSEQDFIAREIEDQNRKRAKEEAEIERIKKDSSNIGRATADDEARAAAIQQEQARQAEALPPNFYSNIVPPRYMQMVKTRGDLEREEKRFADINSKQARVDNTESLIETRRGKLTLEQAKQAYKQDFDAQDRAMRASRDRVRTFTSILDTDAGKFRYQTDPVFKAQADEILGGMVSDAGGESATPKIEPNKVMGTARQRIDSFSNQSVRKIANERMAEANKIRVQIEKAKAAGKPTEDLESEFANIMADIDDLAGEDEDLNDG